MTLEKSPLWRFNARFMVVVHSEQPPSDADWNTSLDEFASKPLVTRVLVYTAGGVPNTQQRVRLTAELTSRNALIAVLTESALGRAVGIALRIFRPEIRTFGPDELAQAFDYLAATPSERDELTGVLDDLKSRLGLARGST